MSLSDGLNEKRDILANVAARLRNQVASASSRRRVKSVIPCAPAGGMPLGLRSLTENSPKKENHNPTHHRSPRGSMSSSRSSARGESSVRGDDDVKMTDINAGPSLYGTADQLAAARQFAATATAGGQRSRAPRGGRERLLTRHASHSSLHSSSGSVHTTRSTPAVTPHAPFQPQQPLPTFNSPSSSKSVNVPMPPTRPSVQPAVGRPPVISNWDAFAKQPTPSTTAKTGSVAGTGRAQKIDHTHAHPGASSTVNDRDAEAHSKLAYVAKTLMGGAVEPKLPPHLKHQAAAAGIPERKAPAGVTAGNGVVNGDLAHVKNIPVGTAASQVFPSPSKSSDVMKEMPVAPASPNKKRKTESVEAVDKHVGTTTAAFSHGGSKANGVSNDTNGIIAAVQLELSAVTKRLTTLELEFQKQIETLMQAEERRVFLGTSNAKAPFGLEVKLSNGSTCVVQAHKELKVADLVRRIRCKADLSHEMTKNPTILVNGQEVGHGMMLGEVGVGSDKQVSVSFRFCG